MNKWKFPHGVDLTPTGVNNTSIEIFLDNIADSLTREVIQNSLDAHDPDVTEPVEVEFDFFSMASSDIPGIKQIKEFALPKAFEMWKKINNEDTLKFLYRYSEVLNDEEISVLRISDYNTKGLNEKNYKSLVLGNAYSEKDNENSAGSKGIGKAAPFAASDLRMVFYNTVPTKEAPKSAGVMNFISFEYDDEGNKITQERATYFEEGKKHIPNQISFNHHRRSSIDHGTDLYILGLKYSEEKWVDKILLSIVNNFLISVINNELEIIVEGKRINHDTLNETLSYLETLKLTGDEKAAFNSTLNFYDVMTNPDTIKLHLDKRFEKYDFYDSPTDGTLFLLQHEPANRTVLQTRKAGMKIYERNRISGNINFTGVFQATGDKLNSFLKDMENANHNTWSKDRLPSNKRKIASSLLTDLLRWYKKEVKDAYEVVGENDVEAFGVSDLLPLSEEYDLDNKDDELDSGVRNKINKINIKNRKTSSSDFTESGDNEDKFLKKSLQEAGIENGDSNRGGAKRKERTEGDNDMVSGEGNPSFDLNDDSDDKKTVEKEQRVSLEKSLSLKIIGIDPSKGKYRIIGNSNKKSDEVEIALKYIGADGKAYSLKVLGTASISHETFIKNRAIRLKDIDNDNRIMIDFEVESKLPMKMEGTVYEIKS